MAGSLSEECHLCNKSQEVPEGFASQEHTSLFTWLDPTFSLPPVRFAFILKARPTPKFLLNNLEFEKLDSAQEQGL